MWESNQMQLIINQTITNPILLLFLLLFFLFIIKSAYNKNRDNNKQ